MDSVLVCCPDAVMSDLLRLNLSRRGYAVRQERWDLCYGPPHCAPRGIVEDIVIADLGCPEPECWTAAESLRSVLPSLPVLFLAYARPGPARLESCQPCAYLQKPFGMDELFASLHYLLSASSS